MVIELGNAMKRSRLRRRAHLNWRLGEVFVDCGQTDMQYTEVWARPDATESPNGACRPENLMGGYSVTGSHHKHALSLLVKAAITSAPSPDASSVRQRWIDSGLKNATHSVVSLVMHYPMRTAPHLAATNWLCRSINTDLMIIALPNISFSLSLSLFRLSLHCEPLMSFTRPTRESSTTLLQCPITTGDCFNYCCWHEPLRPNQWTASQELVYLFDCTESKTYTRTTTYPDNDNNKNKQATEHREHVGPAGLTQSATWFRPSDHYGTVTCSLCVPVFPNRSLTDHSLVCVYSPIMGGRMSVSEQVIEVVQ